MKIRYKIELLSDWHIGSGLDSGTDADVVVLKDNNDLPYIPGKTIKGLLKDSLNEINTIQNNDQHIIDFVFGGELKKKDENDKNKTRTFSGNAFFSDATLKESEQNEIVSSSLQSYLFRNRDSTAIDKRGVAKERSLRTMQVTIQLQLEGYIKLNTGDIEKIKKVLEKAFKWTRYLGVNRNRGLGRCKFILIEN